jgi:hypothetical protein
MLTNYVPNPPSPFSVKNCQIFLNYSGWLLECFDFEVKIRIFQLKVNLFQGINTKSPLDGGGLLSRSSKVGDHTQLISSSKLSLF